ncbi:hypothetical protein BSFA1_76060 (plasmid) [Burkholderia sp. SFA1]|nr:hypothetical protein BSFA1_76060 [Burkholderia sp. SFA1]
MSGAFPPRESHSPPPHDVPTFPADSSPIEVQAARYAGMCRRLATIHRTIDRNGAATQEFASALFPDVYITF